MRACKLGAATGWRHDKPGRVEICQVASRAVMNARIVDTRAFRHRCEQGLPKVCYGVRQVAGGWEVFASQVIEGKRVARCLAVVCGEREAELLAESMYGRQHK